MFGQLSISQKGLLIVVLLVSLSVFFVGLVDYALALSRAIIQAHGGTLAVVDTDQGDVFEVVIPCRGTS